MDPQVNIKFDILSPKHIDAAVNAKYKGELFSDRIWANKAGMIDKLQSSIINAMKGDITIDKIGRDIRDTFNVSAYESQRLVRTETARIQTQASEDIARATGVEQVMWSATLDMLTAPEDAELDGKVWGIDEDHPEPPLHPNCRCCLINVPYEGWTPTQRKDNETGGLIDYADYNNWFNEKTGNFQAVKETNLPQFILAKTIQEAEEKLLQYVSNINLPGAGLSQYNDITRGIENVVNNTELPFVKIPNMTWAKSGSSYMAIGGSNGISIQKTFALDKNIAKRYAKEVNNFTISQKESLDTAESLLKQHISNKNKYMIDRTMKQIQEIKDVKRWAFFSDNGADNMLSSVISHEYGHVIYITKDLRGSFEIAANYNTGMDALKLSKYASGNESETFAEITAGLASGRKSDIPQSLINAYERTIRETKGR